MGRREPQRESVAPNRGSSLPRRGAWVALLFLLGLLSGGCDLLPQNATEWTIALVITGVLFIGIVVMSIYYANKKK